MDEGTDDITRIKEFLKMEPRGLSIRQITDRLPINRNLVAKYLDMLLVSGQVEMRTIGMAKMYYLSHRVPISAMMDFSSDFIIVLDENLKIIQINDNFLGFLHNPRDDVVGKILGPDIHQLFTINNIRQSVLDALKGKEISRNIDLIMGGIDLFYHAKFVPTVFENGDPGVTILLEDTTEIKQAERSLQTAIREKDLLLSEINQKINDNLQLIMSLLELQIDSVRDERIQVILREAQNRIMTLALVYGQLGKAHRGMAIDLETYIRNLTDALLAAYRVVPDSLTVSVEVPGITIAGNKATAMGLVLNEIISYTMTNAFQKGKPGAIRIYGQGSGKEGFSLKISHNGNPFPAGIDLCVTNDLGLQLATTLVTKQLDGTISFDSEMGGGFTIILPGNEQK